MTSQAHDEAVAGFRAYVAANPSPFRDQRLLSERVELEDETPEPSHDPFPKTLGYGQHRCICGGATQRHASNWWCSNPACRSPHPVANEVDR